MTVNLQICFLRIKNVSLVNQEKRLAKIVFFKLQQTSVPNL